MTVLLDTHTLIWAVLRPSFLTENVAQILLNPSNRVLVSAASAWEIATNVRVGKLPGVEDFERNFLEVIDQAGYEFLPIDAACALRAGRFTAEHRDPSDRVLAAQALASDIPIMSSDAKLDAFGVRRIWK